MIQKRFNSNKADELKAEEHEGDSSHSPAKADVIDKTLEHYTGSKSEI